MERQRSLAMSNNNSKLTKDHSITGGAANTRPAPASLYKAAAGKETINNNSSSSSWNYNTDHQQDYLTGGGGFSWPPRSYTCSFCKREFRSAQALGGHMNVHRRDRARLRQSPPPLDSSQPNNNYPILNLNLNNNPSPNPNPNTSNNNLSSSSLHLVSSPCPVSIPAIVSRRSPWAPIEGRVLDHHHHVVIPPGKVGTRKSLLFAGGDHQYSSSSPSSSSWYAQGLTMGQQQRDGANKLRKRGGDRFHHHNNNNNVSVNVSLELEIGVIPDPTTSSKNHHHHHHHCEQLDLELRLGI